MEQIPRLPKNFPAAPKTTQKPAFRSSAVRSIRHRRTASPLLQSGLSLALVPFFLSHRLLAVPKIIFYLTGKAIKVYYSRSYVACIFIWAAVFYKGAISWQK